ncbi:MAG: DUF86 domain-containing protein [Allosphingosinicella sp.]
METVQRFIAGRGRGDLDSDDMFRLALTRAIEVVGEAASRVTAATQHAHSEVPWRALAGMRNRLIHAYFEVDKNVVGPPRRRRRRNC